MPKLNVQLDEDETEAPESESLRSMTSSLPSVSRSKREGLKYAERVQFSFTNVPKPIKVMFAKEAERRGITQKELLFHCLRAGGIDIPPMQEIDGRRR
jgi:hypothetical protein